MEILKQNLEIFQRLIDKVLENTFAKNPTRKRERLSLYASKTSKFFDEEIATIKLHLFDVREQKNVF